MPNGREGEGEHRLISFNSSPGTKGPSRHSSIPFTASMERDLPRASVFVVREGARMLCCDALQSNGQSAVRRTLLAKHNDMFIFKHFKVSLPICRTLLAKPGCMA